MDANQKVSLATLGVLAIVAGAPLVQSCIDGKPPTRAQVQAAEDKYCEAISKIRAVEKALDAGSSEGGSR